MCSLVETLGGRSQTMQNELLMQSFMAQAAWLRYCNGTPPACFRNRFACFGMPSLSLGTQPADVPYAITVVRCEYWETYGQAQFVLKVCPIKK